MNRRWPLVLVSSLSLGVALAAAPADRTDGTRPHTAKEALATLRAKPGFTVELVAAEPQVQSPVAIDWAPDGSLFVAEMRDYPEGMDGAYQPGGAVRRLVDKDGDGRYESSTVFLANVPFVTGVTAYRKGVLVCAAPDLIYAEDTDGDGVADVRRVLYSGFATHNYQARINSIRLGLDNGWYVSGGLFGGEATSFSGKTANVVRQDFRILPDTGDIEPVSGITQQSRVRDDWDNWFGCSSTMLLRHYPLPAQYVRRNPFYAPPNVAGVRLNNAGRINAITEKLQLFELSGNKGTATAACGAEIYRDVLLGEEYYGDGFTCEPVYNAVVRQKLDVDGATFSAHRAEDEQKREFLASTDSWFRPVQVRTGPDGALYVVDMYRFVIEHPKWIPEQRRAALDTRAGEKFGRIFRVYPEGRKPRAVRPVAGLSTSELVAALDDHSGTRRDLVHAELIWRNDRSAAEGLRRLVADEQRRPEVRAQAFAILRGWSLATPELVRLLLRASDPRLLAFGVQASEAAGDPAPLEALAQHPDARVRMQVAFALGECAGGEAAALLARLLAEETDANVVAAAMTSMRPHLAAVAEALLGQPVSKRRDERIELLSGQAVRQGETETMAGILRLVAAEKNMGLLAAFCDALLHEQKTLEQIASDAPALREARAALGPMLREAHAQVTDEAANVKVRTRWLPIVAADDAEALAALLTPRTPSPLQVEVVKRLAAGENPKITTALLGGWGSYSPATRSAVLAAMLNRPTRTLALLDALERDEAMRRALDLTTRSMLINHPDATIKQRAQAALGASRNADRQAAVERYRRELPANGERARGEAVYRRICIACHAVNGVGPEIGPDLGGISNPTPDTLIEAILDPNRAVMDNYLTYVATLKNGQTVVGMIASETAGSVVLRSPDGQTRSLVRADVVALAGTGQSLMPEGLEAVVSPQDMADLVAFIRDLKSQKK